MMDVQRSDASYLGTFGYTRISDRGDHSLVDGNTIAIPGPGEASVAHPGVLLVAGNESFYPTLSNPKRSGPLPHSFAVNVFTAA